MSREGSTFLGMRTHHLVIAIIAILIALLVPRSRKCARPRRARNASTT